MDTQTTLSLAQRLRQALRAPGGAGGDIALVAATQDVRVEDVAEALRDLTNPEALAIFNWLDNARAAAVLGNLEPDTARYLLANAPPSRLADLLDLLPMDDAAWVMSEAPPEQAAVLMGLLQQRAPEDAQEVRELLTYEEGTAGRLMTDKFVRLRADSTVEEAWRDVRRADPDVETLTDVYIVERENGDPEREKLLGVMSLRELVRAKDEECIADVMTTDVISVSVDTDQEEVARQFSKYDFLAMPVLDRSGYFVGIVTVDDVIDVLTEENTEDQLRFGGVSVEEGEAALPYFSTPLARVVKARLGWSFLLFIASTATASVLRNYENDLQTVVALSLFIPLLIGTGGNTGAQAVSTVIRGLALKEIKTGDLGRVILREITGGLMLGVCLGFFGFLAAFVMAPNEGLRLALVVGLTVVAIVTWSNTVGAIIPIVAQRFKVDPALVSAPLITTLVDASGLIIYLSIARALLAAL